MLKRIVTAAVAAVLALAASAPAVYAQKALVYCPVGIDASGCDRIVTALQSTFTGGVDRGYDGSNGTVDLTKIDLHHYGVFVVPSLADDATMQPYALLHSVASRLHFAITGRVAVYSGAPDQGNSNRSDKDALINNLATWAANGHSRATGLVGLVAFLDLSEHVSDRYSWVRDISLTDVSADAQLTAFGDVQAVSPRGTSVLSAGGRSVRFSNMASYGLHIGRHAAARTEVGALGGSTGAQSVLVMYSNADGKDGATTGGAVGTGRVGATGASLDVTGAKATLSSGTTTESTLSSGSSSVPTITTDKPDYQPGDTVTFMGTGFAAGDTVTITVHEDPTWSYPDRQFVAIADANGAFTNRDMIVQQLDLGVTFTATAVAVPSGLVAQTTFTDGNSPSFGGTVTDASNSSALSGVTVTCTAGCNNSPAATTTTNAAGAYVFDNTTTKLSFGGNGPATLTLSFSKPGYQTQSVPFSNINTSTSYAGENAALTPAQATPTFTFDLSTLSKTYGEAPFSVAVSPYVTTNSDGAVSFALGTGSVGCTVSAAGSVTITSAAVGTSKCIIVATLAASSSFFGAGPLTQSFNIAKATQSAVTVTGPSDITFGNTATAVASGGDGTGSYSFDATGSTGCSVTGATVSVTNASGTCSLTATRAADDNYNASVASVPFTVTLHKATQTPLSLTVPASITYGNTGPATASGGSGTGAVSFEAGASTGCAVDATTGVISVSDASGTCSISASKAVDNNYLGPVSDGPKSVTLVKANQSAVSVTAPSSVTFGTTGTAAASGGDGTGAYGFSASGSTGCSVSGTTVSVSNASGTCLLTATKAGDNNYNASAQSAQFSVTLVKANQSAVSMTAPTTVTYGTTGTASASGGDGTGAYSFSAGSSTGCSVSGTTVTVTNASGTCSLMATRAADNNYNVSAPSIPLTVTLIKANQTTAVVVTAPSDVTYGTTGTAQASGGDGTGAYSFSAVGSTGCSVAGTTVSVTDASGTCSLTATRGGDNNYNPSAASAAYTVTLHKATQAALSLSVPSSITYGTTGTATTSGGSGTGAVSFSAGTSSGCSVDGTTGVISVSTASLLCSILASKAGDNNYLGPVSDGPKSVTLNKADQAQVLIQAPSSITYGNTGTAQASGGSGTGAYSFSAGNSTGCTINATTGVISVTNASNSCSITASRAGDNNYKASAPSDAAVVTLIKASATVSLSNLVQAYKNSSLLAPTVTTVPSPIQVTLTFTQNNVTVSTTGVGDVGVYAVNAHISDPNYIGPDDNELFVIYDASNGFVTGGGWINSPAGACRLTDVCTTAVGKANFGFVSKYVKGQSVPTGDTQFQFQAGKLDFKSTSYDWLIISGARAQYKGSGMLNGVAGYQFILTAVDGDVTGGGGTDRFRIKIADASGNVVYDNMGNFTDLTGDANVDITSNPATLLGGGSIQIHK